MALVYDPTKQIYADSTQYKAPATQSPSSLIGNSGSYIDPKKATVSGQVNSNLKKGSPLIESAQADSMKTMNARGGLNSTMAASAGTKAAIDTVMPMASQDAATYADFGKTNQQADIAKNQSEVNAKLQGSLNEQNYGNTQKQSILNTQLTSGLAEQQGQIAKDYKEFSYTFDKALVDAGIDAAERKSAADAISAQTQTLMSNIGTLLNNPDIVMGENVPSWMSDFMYNSWQTTASLYGLDITVV